MTEWDPNALATNGGFAAGLLWILYRIGLRMVATLAQVLSLLVALEAKVGTVIDLTGVRKRAATQPDGTPLVVPLAVVDGK